MALSQAYIDLSIGNIQILHGRYGSEICNILKRHTGDLGGYYELVSLNNIIGKIIDILYNYKPVGNTSINDLTNDLTEVEMMSLINYSYKVLNKYNSNIFLPNNPNTYL
jgi:hypothetical protein